MKVEITGIHFVVSDRLNAYVNKKIGNLEKYVPRAHRENSVAEVRLKESKSSDKKEYICEIVMKIDGAILEAKDSTVNMFAAVDIVETKIKTQLKKRKETSASPKFYRKLSNRFKRTENRAEGNTEA